MQRLKTSKLRLVALVGVCVGAVAALGADRLATATLPQGNEAILLSNQARDAIEIGDYELAIRLIERISNLPESLVPVSGGRTYYPAWREALRLQESLPPEAARQFQLEFDAKVGGRRDAAVSANDLEALRDLFQRFQASTLWPQVGVELAARYLDSGRYYDAVAVLRLLQPEQRNSRQFATQSVVALSAVGAKREAQERLQQYANAENGIGSAERETLSSWMESVSTHLHPSVLPRSFSIADAGPFRWTTSLSQDRNHSSAGDRDAQIADAVDYLRRLPLLQPTISGNRLVVRARGRIFSFDTLSLLPQWSVAERSGTAGEMLDPGSSEDWLSQDAKRLVAHPLAHSLTSAFGLLYTIESLPSETTNDVQFGWAGINSGFGVNTLVARDPQTGDVVWELGADQFSPLFQVAFQDDPVAIGDSLCVVYRRQDDLEMARIDPLSGNVIGQTNLIGPPTFFSSRGGRCTITADDSTVYVSTGNGVLAAMDGRTLHWRWATKYPSLLSSLRGRRWWNRAQSAPPEFGMQRPVIAADLVVFAPADAEQIIAVDRFSGRVRWQIVNRAAYQGIVGIVDAGLILVGHVVTCLAIEDGQRVNWRSVPIEIVGRPVIDGSRIFVPTRGAVLALDAANGKAKQISTPVLQKDNSRLVSAAAADAVAAFALVPCIDGLLAVSPNGVTKYAACAATRVQSSLRLEGDPDSLEAALANAWCDVLSANWRDAIDKLQQLSGGGHAVEQARESLLVRAFVGMASSAEDHQQRLSWLHDALQMDVSRESAAKISLLIGELLEQESQPAAAARHWIDIVFGNADVLVESASTAALNESTCQVAERHLASLLPKLSDADRQELLNDVVERIENGGAWRAGALQRAFGKIQERQAILEAAAKSGLPFELLRLYSTSVPSDDGTDEALTARMALEQWAAVVAIGDLERARRGKAVFDEIVERLSPSIVDDDAYARARTYAQLNFEKLLTNSTAPFAMNASTWRWRRNDVRAIVNMRGRTTARPFLWLRNQETQNFELIAIESGDTWRRIPITAGKSAFADSLADVARDLLQNIRPAGNAQLRNQLHSVNFSDITVVATEDGIAALGNGGFATDRRGGTRLWARQFSVQQGNGRGWAGRICAGADGVFAFVGRDEIVLLDWADGSTRWSRKLPGIEPQELYCVDETLVVVTRDMDWQAFDGATGKVLAGSRTIGRRARSAIELLDRFVVFYDDSIEAIDPKSGVAQWRFPIPRFQWYLADTGSGMLLLRAADEGSWQTLDTTTGTALEFPDIAADGEPVVIARDGERFFVVEREERGDAIRLNYKCYDLNSKQLMWKHGVPANDIPSQSMLTGNPNCVVALVNPDGATTGGQPTPFLGLQLIDKATGEAAEPIKIGAEFARGGFGSSEPMVWVTPTRILVEIHGILAAWGASSWSEAG